jgi:carboxypeptidase Q
MKRSARLVCSIVVLLFSVPALVSQERPEKVDLETISRIRYEGFRNSQVMTFASGLMDSIGERLTGSPNMKRANEWTRDKLTEIGLSNAHLEPWGPFGRGWANTYINVRMTTPDIVPLIAYAKAWTPGTNGVVTGKCIRANIEKRKTSINIAANWRA